jgi:hypothetical protein
MTDVAQLIADMVRAGIDPDIIGRTAAALSEREPVKIVDEQAERRRAKDRERKRLRNSAENAEVCGIKEASPHTPLQENPPPKEKPLRVKKKGASRLPDDFHPDIEWAVGRGLKRQTAELQAEKFVNYWRSAKDGLKTDWAATWRTWVLGAIERNGTDGPSSQTKPIDHEAWQKRLTFGRHRSSWASVDWGPPPGKPGCLVPPELLKPGDGSGWAEWSQSAS